MKLDDWLKTKHSPDERLDVVARLCRALDASHKRGVVRGGVAPADVEIDADGACRVSSDPPGPAAPYTAPELALGGAPTVKAEVYSAGLICYEVLAGRPGFGSEPRAPLKELCPDLPQDLADAITACLEQDPEWRPADLSYVLSVVNGLARAAPPAAPSPPRRVTTPEPRAILETASRGGSRSASRTLPILVLVGAVVAAGGAWLWLNVLHPAAGSARAGTAASASSRPPATQVAGIGQPSPAAEPATLPAAPAESLPPSGNNPAPASAGPSPTPLPTPSPSAGATPRPAPSPTAMSSTATPLPRAQLASPTAAPAAAALASSSASASTDTVPAARPRSEPAPAVPSQATAGTEQAASGPASIRAVSPFQLRAGALHALDVHGENLSAAQQVRIVPLKKRELAAGFTATRHRLRSPSLLLVFLHVDASVRPGKYAFSLVGANGEETNPFTIEIVNK